MRKLVWTQYALLDRDAIFDYIVAESPTAAVRVDEQIGLAIRRLMEFPESGRLGRVLGTPRTRYFTNFLCCCVHIC
ncbi:plasmid stabilization system protein ParE [Phyllobacterium myrsinacearum]|uniref:Plasmid stabilization system protein ParE n=1 Tax=Phyllobacterium myrsinacearum TaxID=28101 RepID=A0A839EX22_9HYPH|nr:plasmid stabilization system protein ParE [Phyllobacterium myrsinacearum]